MYFFIYLHPYYWFVLFMIHFCFVVVIIVLQIFILCINRIFHNIISHQQQKQRKVITIYLLMVYFTFYPAFLFFTLLSKIISYHWFYFQLLFVTKFSLHNLQQDHKTLAVTSAKDWYNWYDVCVTLHQLFNYVYIFFLWFTFSSNIQ